jgi:restriction system protein
MAKAKKTIGITYNDLFNPVFNALKQLGGSGTNNEILEKVIELMNIPANITDVPHNQDGQCTELQYQLAWARTYLKRYGALDNSNRGIWVITPAFANIRSLDKNAVRDKMATIRDDKRNAVNAQIIDIPVIDELPDEIPSWKINLSNVLHSMDPYGFERLSQRLLRECGFSQVEVTKKSGDGGIDGTGKLKINGIFSFNVAFQCKRYKGSVGPEAIRDFRGSLSTDIEKGVFITTGIFTKAAKDEASAAGKKQIDIIDGDEFMNKLAEYGIGLKEVKTYELDMDYFDTI